MQVMADWARLRSFAISETAARGACVPVPPVQTVRFPHGYPEALYPPALNLEVIEEMQRQWLDNPDSVDPTWRRFFRGLHPRQQWRRAAPPVWWLAGAPIVEPASSSRMSIILIHAYRAIGHLQAHLDPLSGPPPPSPKLMLEAAFRLGEADLDTSSRHRDRISAEARCGGCRDIIAELQKTHCGHVGVEYAHIQDQDCRHWLRQRIESTRMQPKFTPAQQVLRIPAARAQGRAFREIPARE